MNIIILNGSPHPKGNKAAMVAAYREGAQSAGHHVDVFDVCRMSIAGCLACEYCHTKAPRQCVQRDDMQKNAGWPAFSRVEGDALQADRAPWGRSDRLRALGLS